jgi:hypothetical protein
MKVGPSTLKPSLALEMDGFHCRAPSYAWLNHLTLQGIIYPMITIIRAGWIRNIHEEIIAFVYIPLFQADRNMEGRSPDKDGITWEPPWVFNLTLFMGSIACCQ